MRKTLSVLTFMVCLCLPATALAMEVKVEISGPQELTAMKDGIGTTILTRCIARGIPVENFSRLSVTISALGEVISYDALLDTDPPRAFHKDIKDVSAVSPTIDEMISTIFAGTEAPHTLPTQTLEKAPGQDKDLRIRLPFMPTSIVSVGGKVFVSDAQTVYGLEGEKTSPLWRAPGRNEILRMNVHEGSILVLTKRMDGVQTFQLKKSETVRRWDKAVIPVGSGLVSTDLRFDRVFDAAAYRWSRASREDGSPPLIPDGLDIISSVQVQVLPSSPGTQIISYDASGRLTVSDGTSGLWTDDENTGITSLFIESKERKEGAHSEGEIPVRYSLKPRILAFGSGIITFRNDQGLGGMLPRMNLFESARVLLFEASGKELSQKILRTYDRGYCVDMALVQSGAAALIVQGKSAYVQFIGL